MRQHTTLLLALAITSLALASTGCDNKAKKSRGATAKELVAAGAVLLDVRSPGEYQRGHLPNAVNIPITELSRRQGEVADGAKVVVYCESGVRSRQAVSLLKKKGHEVFDLGSWRDWGP
ncbi:MAG: rhodanese-like domain-containing protein [Deltaproteobacteria bacterium]|nr:rhodanese-like domain-containing protein [Deltaproteobacteria bacterium]